MLFAPADRADLIAKLPRSRPDAVILDLEAAVPPNEQAKFFTGDFSSVTSELTGIVVPKFESAAEADQVAEQMPFTLPIIAGLETADILSHATVRWTYFGAEDYTTDLGGTRTSGNLEVLYARSHVALAARLAGKLALDIVVAKLDDNRPPAKVMQEVV